MFCDFGRCLFTLTVFIAAANGAEQAAATSESQTNDTEETPYISADPVEMRKQSNARYVGVPVVSTVTRRFEMYDPHSEDALQELKSMGFTQVILDWPTLHAAATKLGLDVVLAHWWIEGTKQEDIDKAIAFAREVDRDKLIGFSVMDEPGRNSPDTPFGYYIDLYDQLKPVFRAEFPATRLEISHWGPMASWNDLFYDYFSFLYEAADVMRIMPYPDLHEAPLDDVFFMIQRSKRLMEIAQTQLPLVVILQAWTLPPDDKLPEIGELRVMAYQAMLSGAETLSFFEYNLDIWKKTPGFHSGFKSLMAELTAFSSQFRDYAVRSTMSEHGVLTSILTSSTGQQFRVEVNTRRTSVEDFDALEVRKTLVPSPPCAVKLSPECDPHPMPDHGRCGCCICGRSRVQPCRRVLRIHRRQLRHCGKRITF